MKSILFACIGFALCFSSYCQTNEWTWMKGDKTLNNAGIYGSQGMSSSVNKPRARYQSVSWTDTLGNLWLFGGVGYNANGSEDYLNDLWKFNISTNNWTWVKGNNAPNKYGIYGIKGVPDANNNPGSRKFSAAWKDKSGNFWLFGGIGYAAASWQYLNDLWMYNPGTNEWTWVKGDSVSNVTGNYGIKGSPATTNNPGGRYYAFATTDIGGNLWLFGGYGKNTSATAMGMFSDLWRFTPSTNNWTWMSGDSILNSNPSYGVKGIATATNHPGSRQTAAGMSDRLGNIWIVGGTVNHAGGYALANDIWKYNIATNQWIWVNGDSSVNNYSVYGTQGISSTASKPGGRQLTHSWKDPDGNMWIFGGYGYTDNSLGYLNDVWKYNFITNEWTWVKGDKFINFKGVYGLQGYTNTLNNPGARGTGVTWTDTSGALWMHGGYGYPETGTITGFLNDLWRFKAGIILPVHLLSFKAKPEGNNIRLYWTVESEQNFDHYEIERSSNGKDFTRTGEQKAEGKKTYTFWDNHLVMNVQEQLIFYRLKLVDKDGKICYSNIISIKLPAANSFSIYPNPASNSFYILPGKGMNGKTAVKIYDRAGQIVTENSFYAKGSAVLFTSEKMLPGVYHVKLFAGNSTYEQQFIVIK